MPNIGKLQVLVQLREDAELSQSQVAVLLGLRSYKSLYAWESGKRIPRKKHRDRFIEYLLIDLGLQNNLDLFYEIWEEICRIEWDWDDLSWGEKFNLHLLEHPRYAPVDKPVLPPHLITHPVVGRERIIEQLRQRLMLSDRVALTGIPGVGKTTLALSVAEDPAILSHFDGGILWASLGKEPSMLEILEQWGVELGRDLSKLASARQRANQLKKIIGSRRILLILDDVWSSRDDKLDMSEVNTLTCGGPNCCHLLTTRIQPIAKQYATHANQVITVTELELEQGYKLLYQLASSVCSVDPPGARDLVRLVGGLPLSLVLLGGYLSSSSYRHFREDNETPYDDLHDAQRRLQLAKSRLGAVDESELTVQQIIELSLDELSDNTQSAYFNLGAFAAKPAWFTRAAAEFVTSCTTADLSTLIDYHLLEVGRKEYLTMHQVLADHARTKMQSPMTVRHRDYYLDLVGEDSSDWQHVLAIYDQIRWAWHCQLETAPEDETLYKFWKSLIQYQSRRGLWADGLELTDIALSLALKNHKIEKIPILLSAKGGIHQRTGDRIAALDSYSQALQSYENLENKDGVASVIAGIAEVYHSMQEYDDAMEYYQNALVIANDTDDETARLTILNNLGKLLSDMGNHEEALDLLHQALNLQKKEG